VKYHILCSKRPPLADIHAYSRLQKSFTALLMVFSDKTEQLNQLQCVLKLWTYFWLRLQLMIRS